MAKTIIYGPQNEQITISSEEEARSLCAGSSFSMTKRTLPDRNCPTCGHLIEDDEEEQPE